MCKTPEAQILKLRLTVLALAKAVITYAELAPKGWILLVNMNENHNYHRGDIYLADLNPYIGSEQGGTRPVLVLQNNAGNFFSPTLIVAPITSRVWKKAKQPTHCRIRGATCLGDMSVVLLEQIKTIDKRRIKKYIGKLEENQMREVDTCIEISLGLHIPEDTEMP